MPETKMPKKVRFVHNKPDDYKVYPANGMWGGVTGRGDFVMHFFLERHDVPDEEIQPLKEDGTVGPVEKKPEEIVTVVRDFQVGILINREQADGIADYTKDRVKEYERGKKKIGTGQ